jgi:hypothetical protein
MLKVHRDIVCSMMDVEGNGPQPGRSTLPLRESGKDTWLSPAQLKRNDLCRRVIVATSRAMSTMTHETRAVSVSQTFTSMILITLLRHGP